MDHVTTTYCKFTLASQSRSRVFYVVSGSSFDLLYRLFPLTDYVLFGDDWLLGTRRIITSLS